MFLKFIVPNLLLSTISKMKRSKVTKKNWLIKISMHVKLKLTFHPSIKQTIFIIIFYTKNTNLLVQILL